MSLRRATPLVVRPQGLSDALDSSAVFPGAMAALRNLIPDPSTKNLWQCRPAAIQLNSGSALPTPVGVISCMLIVGDIAYGMVDAGGIGKDFPFAFDLIANAYLTVTGITTANRPTVPPATGAWTPPIMDIVGKEILVAHPGFNGTGGNWFGWFNISALPTITWSAGDLTGAITFASVATPPTSVANFNGRAYWMVNPISGSTPPATIFSDVLLPRNVTAGTQILTYEDNTKLTALGKLGLSTQLGGITQALIVFKGVKNIYQVTGDAALNNLSRNALNVATGTISPLSIAATPKGLLFAAPDGLRLIDFNARVSDPIGTDGMGKTLPFIYTLTPSRTSAAANGTIYRVSLDDGSRIGTPLVEYWCDFSRQGVWSGPHTFPSRIITSYGNTFITAPWTTDSTHPVDGTLWRSDYVQTSLSTFVENSTQLSFSYATSTLPDTDQMCENNILETTIYLAMAAGADYLVQALDEASAVLSTAHITNPTSPVIWGSFTWGSALWGGASAALAPRVVKWPAPVVFRRMLFNVMGDSAQAVRIGALHMRYEQLGYLQQQVA